MRQQTLAACCFGIADANSSALLCFALTCREVPNARFCLVSWSVDCNVVRFAPMPFLWTVDMGRWVIEGCSLQAALR